MDRKLSPTAKNASSSSATCASSMEVSHLLVSPLPAAPLPPAPLPLAAAAVASPPKAVAWLSVAGSRNCCVVAHNHKACRASPSRRPAATFSVLLSSPQACDNFAATKRC